MPRGYVTATRTYGPYRNHAGERTVIKLNIRHDENSGKTTASFQGKEFAKHSSHPHSAGQTQGSAPRALKDLWNRWHLNEMQAGCEHQRALGWISYEEHPSEPCPVCSYKFGSAWLFDALPDDFLALCDAAGGSAN